MFEYLVFLIFKKEQENDGVGDISSLFERHCQTNRLDYKQAVLYIQSWQALVSQSLIPYQIYLDFSDQLAVYSSF